jgi:outer membrane protein OmpA-like peptidoglycan-associated protein
VIAATTDGDGHVHIDDKPPGAYTVEIPAAGTTLTSIELKVEDPEGNPVTGASGTVTLSDGTEIVVMTDGKGEVHLTDVPPGQYTFKLDDEGSGASPAHPDAAESPAADERKPEPEGPDTASVQAALEAAHFDTDKALPLPGAIPVFRAIAALLQQEPSRVVLVVGHADAVGGAAHNLELSADRAQAVAAYIRDDADAWVRFYDHPTASARWGTREDQLMLSALPHSESPYYDGEIDGVAGPITRAAFKELQKKNGLPQTGKADRASRRALALEYMQAEGTSAPAADVRTLACGERHLLEQTSGASRANRRVDVFAFASGEIVPAPEDCREGKHPGCDVYDRWKKAVTGKLGAEGDKPRPPKTEDLVPKARQLHKAFLDARDGFVRWNVGRERSAKRYIGEWCEGLAKDKKFKDRIDLAKLQREKQQDQAEMRQKQEEVERRAKELLDFLDDPRLKKQLRRMGAAGLREAASLVQGVGESLGGSAWIARQIEAGEGGEGLLSWVLSKEGAEQATTGAEAAKKNYDLLQPVLEALAETVGTTIRLKQEKAVEYIAEIIAVRFNLRAANLITRQVIEIRGGMVSAVLYRREITILRRGTLLDPHTVETFGKALSGFEKLVAAVNLLAKLDLLAHDPSLRNVISTIGGLAELLDTFETVRSMTSKWVRYGRELAEDGAPKAVEDADSSRSWQRRSERS